MSHFRHPVIKCDYHATVSPETVTVIVLCIDAGVYKCIHMSTNICSSVHVRTCVCTFVQNHSGAVMNVSRAAVL